MFLDNHFDRAISGSEIVQQFVTIVVCHMLGVVLCNCWSCVVEFCTEFKIVRAGPALQYPQWYMGPLPWSTLGALSELC